MKKRAFLVMIIALAGLVWAGPAGAVSLSFSPSSQTVSPGDSLLVDVVISGLGDFADPSVGAFDLDVTYDSTILTATGITFGNFLGDIGLGEAFIIASDISTPGLVDIGEASLLENDSVTCVFCIPPYLEDIQPASFVLATLAFDALAGGTSALAFDLSSPNEVVDGFGAALSLTTESGSVTVSSLGPAEAVPEPASLLLLGTGLAGIGFVRRRREAEAF